MYNRFWLPSTAAKRPRAPWTPPSNSRAMPAHDYNRSSSLTCPMLLYDMPGSDPTHVRDALVERGEHVITDAVASMKRTGVQGTPRIVETDLAGDDIAHRIQRAAANSRPTSW